MAKTFHVNSLDGFFLLRNGKVWNSSKKDFENVDILLNNGVIDRIGTVDEFPENTRLVDCGGAMVFPGLMDMHVHLREPGFEEKETIATGCAAAAAGGFTRVCCMPNTNPVTDNQEVVKFVRERAADQLVEVHPAGAVTKGLKGEELAEIGFMVDAGIVGVTDDGMPVKTPAIMRRALEYVKRFDIPVMEHAEECSLTQNASMNESFYSTKLGLHGWPTIAEDMIVQRDIMLAEYVGSRIHIQHISSARSVELIRLAKDKGIRVTAEATPHHFSLTDKEIQKYDTNFKMNPPLRSEEDVEAVIEGLKDGTIDAIATDHAPHEFDSKDREFDIAANGVTGLETAVGTYFTELAGKHGFGIASFVELFIENPRRITGIDIPSIVEGKTAELSVIDPDFEWTVEADEFFSRSKNSCFLGKKLKGKAVATAGRGKIWWKNKIIK